MKRLLENIKLYTPISEEIQLLKEAVDTKTYAKNELIFTEGKIAKEIYFVTKGCVRLFYNVDGNDKTAFFYSEGQFICAGESYTYNIPAIENYQGIEPTELLVFTKSATEKLLNAVPKLEIIARIATERIDYQPKGNCIVHNKIGRRTLYRFIKYPRRTFSTCSTTIYSFFFRCFS